MQKLKIKNLPTGYVMQEISLAKNNLISVKEFRELYQEDESYCSVGDIYEFYEDEKRQKLLLDFDDLLFQTYQLLKEKDDIREKYQRTFKHILVDEFQDTNPAKMEILNLLVGNGNGDKTSFWICGDDWQSIFSFTEASVKNILNFNKVYPRSQLFLLTKNYRSTPQILKVCQNLIKYNKKRIDKALRTDNTDGEDVVVLDGMNEEDESTKIVNEIKNLTDSKGYSHRDIAVLYRCNYQSRVIEEILTQEEIPYHIENGMSFYQRFEVSILLDYMRLIVDPDSDEGDEALKNVINIPNRYFGKKFIDELEEHSNKKEVHLYEGLKSLPVKVPYLKKNMRDFRRLLNPLIGEAHRMEPSELIYLLREGLEYDKFITEDDIPSPDDSKIANINQLQLAASKYKDIKSFLNYTETFQEESSNDKNGISLMTIHKSKGLEFPVVFVIGLVEGILPNKLGDIEEERRIAFVGLSRAMRLLYLTYSHSYGGRRAKKSSFLDEMFEK